MKKKIGLSFLFFLLASTVFADSLKQKHTDKPNEQLISSTPVGGAIDLQQKKSASEILEGLNVNDNEKFSSITDETIQKLDQLLETSSYKEIDRYLKNTKADIKIIHWLERHSFDGNVLLMWHLADKYASIQRIELAVNWSFSALFGVMQEQHLCTSSETRYAAAAFSEAHPSLLMLNRQNPNLLRSAKLFAINTLMNAHHYSSPNQWLCNPFSGELAHRNKTFIYTYDAIYFDYLRAEARNKLRTDYEITASPFETIPAVPLGQSHPGISRP